MAKVDTTDIVALQRKMVDLLSEYGVDRAGIDAAIDIAIAYGESEHAQGFTLGADRSQQENWKY